MEQGKNQEKKKYPDIPVIILTAIDMVEMAVNCIKYRAAEYLVKHVDTENLIKTIGKSMEMEPNQ